jgi:hypothetical protein
MLSILIYTTLLLATNSFAQTPIPRVGDNCPTGTYRSRDYCKPFKSSEDQDGLSCTGPPAGQ